MNIHTRLVGAIDAVVLSLTAVVTLTMLFVLLSPQSPLDRNYTVTIEQLPA